MMLQHLLIVLIFIAAAAYLLRMVYLSFRPNKNAGCARGCGSCSAIDLSKISKEIERAQAAK
ncbi:MAG: FeoB-associated Cys-rich membrane protein [Hymenobacteraceae bacterium]|nr:FeoB-associated Cys-rich membrane protein [Hymenobacteraceae bacterium]MDX5395761.1 FeoB-associated Cys-rich membrane protein [Hymenobacteraceae bacterium]MDX5511816.1 FeoB-associated Cys-rich membrane protein [Hymenobacteraceae bacterium]